MVNSDHVVVSVSINYPSISKRYVRFYGTAYDYYHTDWDSACDHLSDVYGIISLSFVLLLLVLNFVKQPKLELMYIFLIVNIRSSLLHINGFKLLVLLP